MSLPPFPPEESVAGVSLPDAAVIRLPAHCGTAAAPAVHQALVDAVAGGGPLTIHAGDVETLGQAMLQLLLAARAAAPALTIDPISPALMQRFHALSVVSALGLSAEQEALA